jgi:hypothetical protein
MKNFMENPCKTHFEVYNYNCSIYIFRSFLHLGGETGQIFITLHYIF